LLRLLHLGPELLLRDDALELELGDASHDLLAVFDRGLATATGEQRQGPDQEHRCQPGADPERRK
jgi:hypothetical protein